jgi:two-component system response regulator YesN
MSCSILIADDEELERRALRLILGTIDGLGFDIVEASNGRQAIDIAGKVLPDIALLDIRMPGASGIDAAREFRLVSPRTRCVFITAFESFDYAREAIRLGVDEYLLKPAEPEAVKETVLRVLEQIQRERSEAEKVERKGAEGELALDLLERELRSALDRGTLFGDRLQSFFALRGLPEGERFTLVVRPAVQNKWNAASRRAVLKKLESIVEKVLREEGWFVISGADDSEVRTAAACVVGKKPDGPLSGSVKKLFERIAEQSLVGAGVRIFIGASPSFVADGPELFSAAQDALALASENHSIVVLEPTVGETAADTNRRVSNGGPVVDRAIEYLRSRISEDVSLSDVAAAVSCSPFHMSRLFRLYAGDTFVRFFSRMRVDAAKALLRSGEYSVKEVCSMVGFSDLTYFARVFRKFEGITPAEYKADTASEARRAKSSGN